MKNTLLLLFFPIAVFLNACSEGFSGDEGYNWEKKNTILAVPFYPDSLIADTLNIRIRVWEWESNPEIIYSSTQDSFIITADIKGENFQKPGMDTVWKAAYQYEWSKSQLDLNYLGHGFISARKKIPIPLTTPLPVDVTIISKMKIEVPKTLKHVKLSYY